MTEAVSSSQPHASVMLREMLAALAPKDGELIVDGTFGAGGYTRAILDEADCSVFSIDRDGTVLPYVEKLRAAYGERFHFLSGAFGDMEQLLRDAGVEKVHGIVLDIGVSSMQLDQAERGFSFKKNGPLDMRMAQKGQTAADVVNTATEEALADILYYYGEEKQARRIARAIVKAREETPFTTTLELSALVAKVVGKGWGKIDPATRTFQALRIYVNDELGELVAALEAAERLLAPGGRLVVVTFHSLEDRIVKRFFHHRAYGAEETVSRHMPQVSARHFKPSFLLPNKKAQPATEEESRLNARARSAKLRVGVRTEASALAEPFMAKGEVYHVAH